MIASMLKPIIWGAIALIVLLVIVSAISKSKKQNNDTQPPYQNPYGQNNAPVQNSGFNTPVQNDGFNMPVQNEVAETAEVNGEPVEQAPVQNDGFTAPVQNAPSYTENTEKTPKGVAGGIVAMILAVFFILPVVLTAFTLYFVDSNSNYQTFDPNLELAAGVVFAIIMLAVTIGGYKKAVKSPSRGVVRMVRTIFGAEITIMILIPTIMLFMFNDKLKAFAKNVFYGIIFFFIVIVIIFAKKGNKPSAPRRSRPVEVQKKYGRVNYDGNGRINRIGEDMVFYDGNGRINRIGEDMVFYDGNGRINRIGEDMVFYDGNGRIDRIE